MGAQLLTPDCEGDPRANFGLPHSESSESLCQKQLHRSQAETAISVSLVQIAITRTKPV